MSSVLMVGGTVRMLELRHDGEVGCSGRPRDGYELLTDCPFDLEVRG